MIEDVSKYLNQLIEIKYRTKVLQDFLYKKRTALYKATTIESACLLRKIMELIAFSSLVANKDIFSQQYEKFSKYRNARLMIQDLGRVNSSFYPKPISQVPSNKPGIKNELLDISEDQYLNKSEFIKVYEKCGSILHAENPYGSKIDYRFYETQLPIRLSKTITLLNTHIIKLVDDDNLYLFQMGDEGKAPTYNLFGKI